MILKMCWGICDVLIQDSDASLLFSALMRCLRPVHVWTFVRITNRAYESLIKRITTDPDKNGLP